MLNHVRKHKENFTDLNSGRKTEKKNEMFDTDINFNFSSLLAFFVVWGLCPRPLSDIKNLKVLNLQCRSMNNKRICTDLAHIVDHRSAFYIFFITRNDVFQLFCREIVHEHQWRYAIVYGHSKNYFQLFLY
jgi:hypothetical protein